MNSDFVFKSKFSSDQRICGCVGNTILESMKGADGNNGLKD